MRLWLFVCVRVWNLNISIPMVFSGGFFFYIANCQECLRFMHFVSFLIIKENYCQIRLFIVLSRTKKYFYLLLKHFVSCIRVWAVGKSNRNTSIIRNLHYHCNKIYSKTEINTNPLQHLKSSHNCLNPCLHVCFLSFRSTSQWLFIVWYLERMLSYLFLEVWCFFQIWKFMAWGDLK